MQRGITINRELNKMNGATVEDMKSLQCSNYNVLAEFATPLILKNIHWNSLDAKEKQYANILSSWNYQYRGRDIAPTLYEVIWKTFYDEVYKDEYAKVPENTTLPFTSTLIEALKKDSAYKFVDDIRTDTVESLPMVMTNAFKKAMKEVDSLEKINKLKWSLYQDTHIDHLLKLDPFSTKHIFTDGGANTPNAVKSTHGPSWRMIVHLLPNTEAFGIYPGGQNGNPGSKYYDDGIAKWAKGEYYTLWQMNRSEKGDKRIKWKMKFDHQ
jgi:penicillin amidase